MTTASLTATEREIDIQVCETNVSKSFLLLNLRESICISAFCHLLHLLPHRFQSFQLYR